MIASMPTESLSTPPPACAKGDPLGETGAGAEPKQGPHPGMASYVRVAAAEAGFSIGGLPVMPMEIRGEASDHEGDILDAGTDVPASARQAAAGSTGIPRGSDLSRRGPSWAPHAALLGGSSRLQHRHPAPHRDVHLGSMGPPNTRTRSFVPSDQVPGETFPRGARRLEKLRAWLDVSPCKPHVRSSTVSGRRRAQAGPEEIDSPNPSFSHSA